MRVYIFNMYRELMPVHRENVRRMGGLSTPEIRQKVVKWKAY